MLFIEEMADIVEQTRDNHPLARRCATTATGRSKLAESHE
jgi:hypothetical protein